MDGGRDMQVLRLDSDLLTPNRTVMGVKPIIRRAGSSRSVSRSVSRKGKSGDGSRSVSRSASRKARDGASRSDPTQRILLTPLPKRPIKDGAPRRRP
jgi:hypothetical protein